MNDDDKRKLIRDIISCDGIAIEGDSVIIYPPNRMYDEWGVSFETLLRLSKTLGTKDINFSYNAGWGGTDVTPGDPATLCLHVRGIRWP